MSEDATPDEVREQNIPTDTPTPDDPMTGYHDHPGTGEQMEAIEVPLGETGELAAVCETCGGLGYVVVGQTHDWPYGEQIQCPDCAEVCETCGGGGEVPGPITETGLWHKKPCPVCRPDEGAE